MARIGQIALFGGTFVPQGWAKCNGENGTPNLPGLVYNEDEEPLTYLMATEDKEDSFIMGLIMPTALDFAPRNWAFCEGQIMEIMRNTALYSILGTTYGGNGRDTFALPKLNNTQAENKGTIRYMICTSGVFPMRS